MLHVARAGHEVSLTKLFVVGPVEIEEDVLQEGARQPPYFRDSEFAEIVLWVSAGIARLLLAPPDARVALLTASGTAAMEAAVINLFDERSRVLVIDGGSFGHRFADICRAHGIPHDVLAVRPGNDLPLEAIAAHRPVDGILMNAHETSTGQRNDVARVGDLCRERGALLVCDAISSFLADPFDMAGFGVNAAVLSSNKGLAVAPGLSMVVMDGLARSRLKKPRSLYLRLSDYFDNGVRGQTPYTPSTTTILQLRRRIEKIDAEGGPDAVVRRVAAMAADFRDKARVLGLPPFPETPSNYLTCLMVPNGTARQLYDHLKREHRFFVTPPTWGFEREIPRVCHAGNLTPADNTALVAAISATLPQVAVPA